MRIYDCFPFDGELDLLEFRLRETFDLVDVFALVEAAETFQGNAKPCLFAENKSRFAWASDKLRHVRLSSLGHSSMTPRERAAVQRNAAMLALRDLEAGDVVLLLDVDEIASRAFLTGLRQTGLAHPVRLSMTRHYLQVDWVGPASSCCEDTAEPFACAKDRLRPGAWGALPALWYGKSGMAVPAAALLGDVSSGLSATTPFRLRFGNAERVTIANAGRHFSSVDPSSHLERKLFRVFHDEWATPRATRAAHLERCRRHGVHHRGWWYAEPPEGPLPDDLQRLLSTCVQLRRHSDLPPLWRRRAVRTWAWVRLWSGWPERLVGIIDDSFEALLPFITVPLTLAGLSRRLCANVARQRGRSIALKWPKFA